MGLGALNFGVRYGLVGHTDSRCEGAQLSNVLRTILAHREVQPDLKLLQKADGQVLVARDEPDDFGAAIHRLSLFQSLLLQTLAQTIAGPEQHYT